MSRPHSRKVLFTCAHPSAVLVLLKQLTQIGARSHQYYVGARDLPPSLIVMNNPSPPHEPDVSFHSRRETWPVWYIRIYKLRLTLLDQSLPVVCAMCCACNSWIVAAFSVFMWSWWWWSRLWWFLRGGQVCVDSCLYGMQYSPGTKQYIIFFTHPSLSCMFVCP